ncbi:MAG: aspartyl-tRNA(Asn)/glutamyl-tRNA(Gln) amidotransferase subunit [Frankiaceae bacterium]|jgi:aspartyl-tRNA(Asn)/glutamyl-tRNA(Gln) amidotransferase subunit C|nr:aspartyl-tRNA(Asn)/glutamyl-tRNA(Gln) amidotransferase subunit [Frankiaceae bacterium]
MTLNRQEVAHLARLSRLSLSSEELDEFAPQLDEILSWVARVGEAASADVPPTTSALDRVNIFRPDIVRPSLDRDEVLSSAPSAEDGRFRVPRILDEE